MSRKKIIVTGDVAIDHLYYPLPPKDTGRNWQLYNSLKTTLMPGGVFLLSDFVTKIAQSKKIDIEIITHDLPKQLDNSVAKKMIQAKVFLKSLHDKAGSKELYRVDKYYGYSCENETISYIPKLSGNSKFADLLIIDDAGNGFRDVVKSFPLCIENPKIFIVYKMSRPIAEGKLWKKLIGREDNWITIINAKDIRNCNNVYVSKSLSWERTALEMIYQIERSESLFELQKIPNLVILFGTDGALLYTKDREKHPQLIFDPNHIEGGFASTIDGYSLGSNSIFTATFSAHILENGVERIIEGIKTGLSAMRNLHENGFELRDGNLEYPVNTIMHPKKYAYSNCKIERQNHLNNPDPKYYRILDQKTKYINHVTAIDIVKHKNPTLYDVIPMGNFGKMETIDRREIEQYNAIKTLIKEFLDDSKPARPLCFSVFGAPGSGKSFGIKQVLESFKRKDIETLTFNISQYTSYNDLIADFHKIRDKVLSGIIPVAFFDEFDSNLDNKPLGWLKYFLSPMQDGEFKEGETVHPIGKSILVFAGGTRSSFDNFVKNKPDNGAELNFEDELTQNKDQQRLEQFTDAKGPDFVSRLRGFINIMGPNQLKINDGTDEAFIIRRARMFRTIISKTQKAKQLFNSHGELQIDNALLRAILNITTYKHGNRSMSAIIDMSCISDKRRFDLSTLPTPEQLNVHVDSKLFMWLAAKERIYTLLPVKDRAEITEENIIEWEEKLIISLAKRIHDDYYQKNMNKEDKTKNAIEWNKLSDDKKRSNFDAAEDIPNKLLMINLGLCKDYEGLSLPRFVFRKREIELLARAEHYRWCREQQIQQWTKGEIRDDIEKKHPNLTEWKNLSQRVKDIDIDQIKLIPKILNEEGYKLYRINQYI